MSFEERRASIRALAQELAEYTTKFEPPTSYISVRDAEWLFGWLRMRGWKSPGEDEALLQPKEVELTQTIANPLADAIRQAVETEIKQYGFRRLV